MTLIDFSAAGEATPPRRPVHSERFKEALSRLAGGLAIVTCGRGRVAQGILVSSITGLSVEPPRYLFCIRREASAHNPLLKSQQCGVSVLSAVDEVEARSFVDPCLRDNRFSGVDWRISETHPPLLMSSLSTAVCRIDSRIDAGSHSIFVATAESLDVREGEPLLSFDRTIRRLRRGDELDRQSAS